MSQTDYAENMPVISAWPVVVRDRIVHAFKPVGSPGAEAPFRTLRRHAWVSPGVRVPRRSDHGLAGQMTVFSSLNVAAARLARRGDSPAAERVARVAASLESGPEFALLRRLLSELPGQEADQVIGGELPAGAPDTLVGALRAIAARTGQVCADDVILSSPAEMIFAGRIAEVREGYVLLAQVKGPSTMVPRWMAAAAHREQVGDLLALISDKLDDVTAVVEAVPAIEIDDPPEISGFAPFGRDDARTRSITVDDARLLAGHPQPLQILFPVTIGE
jgi:hypothetical protein